GTFCSRVAASLAASAPLRSCMIAPPKWVMSQFVRLEDHDELLERAREAKRHLVDIVLDRGRSGIRADVEGFGQCERDGRGRAKEPARNRLDPIVHDPLLVSSSTSRMRRSRGDLVGCAKLPRPRSARILDLGPTVDYLRWSRSIGAPRFIGLSFSVIASRSC